MMMMRIDPYVTLTMLLCKFTSVRILLLFFQGREMNFSMHVHGAIFLQNNYELFVHTILPQDFFQWLRVKHVFTASDEEEVEQKYATSYLRAGCEIKLSIVNFSC